MRIAVIGTGYVGLVAGTCFADSGNEVVCVDIDEAKIQALQCGLVPVYEPGLDDLIHKNAQARRLEFSTDLAASVSRSEVVFIAVGTPEGETGGADLRHVLAAARQIGQSIRHYTVVVNKSTVPAGTADKVREVIAANTQVEFDVVSNPEFLKEGAALDDFLKPDRVVIGTTSERARRVMAELYAPFVRTENPVLFMDSRSAEITKYAANAMLAARISFMNDIAMLCEHVGADVDFVRKGMGADKRIGYPFLFPGVGYGGSCFPKDVKALAATAREHGLELELLHAVERINDRQKRVLLQKALKHFGSLSGRTFAVWGVSFKPQTDDVREASSLVLIEGLLDAGATVQVYDPVAMPVLQRTLGDRVRCARNLYAAAEGAEGLFLVTEWNEFRQPDFDQTKAIMKTPVIFDGRNVYDPARLREKGFVYYGIGRGA